MRRGRPAQRPATNFVFRKVNSRHYKNQDIVNCHRDCGGDLVASTYPRQGNRKKRLQTPKRRESEKDSDS
jgi:hypothetical protein